MARTDKNHPERRAQIARIAAQVFIEYGYENTTNKLIAERIEHEFGGNFTPQLIYHYFESKVALFKAVLEQFPVPEMIRAEVEQAMGQPPANFFRRVALLFLELFDDPINLGLFRLTQAEGNRHPELIETVVSRVLPALVMPSIQYITQETKAGRFRPCHPALVVGQFFGPLVLLLLPVTEHLLTLPLLDLPFREEMIAEVVNNFLHGLLPPVA